MATSPAERPARLRRDPDRAVLGGLAAGLARALGLDPLLVRVVLVVLTVATGGLAAVGYLVGWALVPAAEGGGDPGRGRLSRPAFPRFGGRLAAGCALLVLAGLLSFRELGIWWSDALAWPLVLAAAGAGLLWWQSRPDPVAPPAAASSPRAAETTPSATPSARRAVAGRERLASLYRGGFGVALVLGAALLFLALNDKVAAVGETALTAFVVALAIALVLAPFLWRLGRRFAAERAERIRSQERAEVAAHLHDSVLQTLALVQKRIDDPREVRALARRQERELRDWLAAARPEPGRLAAALRSCAAGVEDDHRVRIEAVIVGDCELDEPARAILGAAGEALTNAAKFAPEETISLYAEIGEREIEAWVRDRGPGFDPERLPADRHGVRESILGRIERAGGEARITRPPEGGTEVALRVRRGRPG
jgi:signal transduction histidine kinase/phage shock protein PspC (stress-responsive transcriptional regulator)